MAEDPSAVPSSAGFMLPLSKGKPPTQFRRYITSGSCTSGVISLIAPDRPNADAEREWQEIWDSYDDLAYVNRRLFVVTRAAEPGGQYSLRSARSIAPDGATHQICEFEAVSHTLVVNDSTMGEFCAARGGHAPPASVVVRLAASIESGREPRSRGHHGRLSARYWSEAAKERREPSGVFYYWKGERPRDPNAPQLDGTGEFLLESADRGAGYFTTRSDTPASVNARTAGVYWRADAEDMGILDGSDDRQRAELIGERLRHWKSITNAK